MKRTTLTILAAVAVVVTLSGFMFQSIVKGIFANKREMVAASTNALATAGSLHDFNVKSLDGKPVALKQYAGKKVVILNTASKCGFTPQYSDWEKFYKANKDKVVVLGFPANNFGGQEPGSSNEIGEFCQKNYGVTFPMMEKVSVLGDDQAPLYKWLTTKTMNGWNDKAPTWNFCKYVINEKGQLTHFFASKVKPDDAEFKQAVGL
jgi:glutathione peroxidase